MVSERERYSDREHPPSVEDCTSISYSLCSWGIWEVEYTHEFEDWWETLTVEQQEAIDDRVMLLETHGPALRRPVVGSITNSRHPNMKELRASKGGALRVLFAFDPRRHAILLLGGDKSGEWERWYEVAIPEADDLYDTPAGAASGRFDRRVTIEHQGESDA